MSNRRAPTPGYHPGMKYLPLIAMVLLTGCGASDESQIRALEARLGQAMAAHDLDVALRCYAQDAVLLLPGRPGISGREAIRDALRAAFAGPRASIAVQVQHVEVDAAGQMAFAYGIGLTTVGDGPGAPPPSTSKWLSVFRKRDGAWEIAADAFNEPGPVVFQPASR